MVKNWKEKSITGIPHGGSKKTMRSKTKIKRKFSYEMFNENTRNKF